MSKTKRFSWSNLGETDAIADGDTFRWYLCKCEDMDKLVEFMNELASENERLSQKVQTQSIDRELLCQRIDRLKSDLNHELEVSKSLRDVVKSLETENMKLKNISKNVKQIKYICELLFTQVEYVNDNVGDLND